MALNGTYRAATLALATAIAPGLALGGCTRGHMALPPLTAPINYSVEAMPDCMPAVPATSVVATISITLPRRLNFAGYGRTVSWASGYVDPATPRLDLGNANGRRRPEPFDVIVGEATSAASGYVLIRAAIPRHAIGSNLEFLTVGTMGGTRTMAGVGAGYVPPTMAGVLCGGEILAVNSGTIQDVAFFYLDLARWTDRSIDIPFTINVMAGDLYATPIIIDPKLRNNE